MKYIDLHILWIIEVSKVDTSIATAHANTAIYIGQ